MINPLRSSLPPDLPSQHSSDGVVLTLRSAQKTIMVTHDGFSIGSHRYCDLTLLDHSVQSLHSVIHMQCGAFWIEAASEDSLLIVNDRVCRRMALRHGDRFIAGETLFTIDLKELIAVPSDACSMVEQTSDDLASLTAEELCDRIVTEQSLIQEMSSGKQSGWEALLHAIEAIRRESFNGVAAATPAIPLADEVVLYDTLYGQIKELQETIDVRARELSQHESEMIASSSILEESQQRVAHRLDAILEQLTKSDTPNEFRASA